MKKIKLIEVPSEIGAGTRGASLGIEAMKIAAMDFMSNFFAQYPSQKVAVNNQVLFEPLDSPYAKRISSYEKIFTDVCDAVKVTVQQDIFPIVLTGDHSSSAAIISGLKLAKPKSRIGVVWIDAHSDFHSPYTSPSGNLHGMPLALVTNEDNKENASNKPDEKAIAIWEKLKSFGGIAPKIDPRDIVFISLRDSEKEERRLLDKLKSKIISSDFIRQNGAEEAFRATIRHLSSCTDIFVSFDVDSLDPSITKGTGTPVMGGLKEREAEDLVCKFMLYNNTSCFEISEVNPTLDNENLMAEIAFNILQRGVNNYLRN